MGVLDIMNDDVKENGEESGNNPLLNNDGKPEDVLDLNIMWFPTEQCVPWEKHDRFSTWYNEKECEDLINSIKKKGDQEIPALIRAIPSDKYPKGHINNGKKYEIIYGARRHYACSVNKVPVFLAKLCAYDDKKCRALMHIENAQRKDISKMERAKAIAEAYREDYQGESGSYRSMALDYKETKSTLEEYEKAGRIWFVSEINVVFEDLAQLPISTTKKIIGKYEESKERILDVIGMLLSDKKYMSNSSDKHRAKQILKLVENKEESCETMYKSNNVKFAQEGVGVVTGKVTSNGYITIKLPPSAAKINKKEYSAIVFKIMSDLGMR